MTEFQRIDIGSYANPCHELIRCCDCGYEATIGAHDFAVLQDLIHAAIQNHITDAHPEANESVPDLRRQLADSRAAYADLERMYHRVAREHLVTALRLHKARALIRRLRRRGIL